MQPSTPGSAIEITPAQRRVLVALVEIHDKSGRPPSLREICAHVGRTINAVHESLQRLAHRRLAERLDYAQRGWTATADGRALVGQDGASRCPTCGRPLV